jgi:hypothetical protein
MQVIERAGAASSATTPCGTRSKGIQSPSVPVAASGFGAGEAGSGYTELWPIGLRRLAGFCVVVAAGLLTHIKPCVWRLSNLWAIGERGEERASA